MAKGKKVSESSKANGMTAGPVIKSKPAGNDPYNKAGKAAGRDATSWSKGGSATPGPGAYK